MNSNVNGGRCQCAWGQLYKIMPDELIKIIDGYVHLSDYIYDAVFSEIGCSRNSGYKQTLFCYVMNRNKKSRPMWTFSGDIAGNSGFDMGRIGCGLNGDGDIFCKIIAGTEGCEKIIQLSINGDVIKNPKWDGFGLTPFSRISRHCLRYDMDAFYHCRVTGINKDPFDVMCNGAHAAIWTWFHGGDPTKTSQ